MSRYPQDYIHFLLEFHATRDYFECHEILEEFWKEQVHDEQREVWKILIQIAVGLYHARRGKWAGAIKMFASSLNSLDTYDLEAKCGIDQHALRQLLVERVEKWRAALNEVVSLNEGPPFEDMMIPILDGELLETCRLQCRQQGLVWGRSSPLDEVELIERHRLRDRSDVIAARAEAWKLRSGQDGPDSYLPHTDTNNETRFVAFEPTPSPNVMKLSLAHVLKPGVKFEFTVEQSDAAPEWLRPLLMIEGVKSIYATADFVALERLPNANWHEILSCIPGLPQDSLELMVTHASARESSNLLEEARTEREFQVFVQELDGIPMQVKLISERDEFRYAMPDVFVAAAVDRSKQQTNLITDRRWRDCGTRYGLPDDLGRLIIEEEVARNGDLIGLSSINGNSAGSRLEAVVPDTASDTVWTSFAKWQDRYAYVSKLTMTLDHLPDILAGLRDPHPSIRRLCVVYLGEWKESIVFSYLFKALRDPAISVRRTVGDTLSDLGDPIAIPYMIDALKDEHKLMRWRAARYLFEVGDQRAVDGLRQAMHDPEFEVALQAKMALDRLEAGVEASGTMWQQIAKSSKNVQ